MWPSPYQVMIVRDGYQPILIAEIIDTHNVWFLLPPGATGPMNLDHIIIAISTVGVMNHRLAAIECPT